MSRFGYEPTFSSPKSTSARPPKADETEGSRQSPYLTIPEVETATEAKLMGRRDPCAPPERGRLCEMVSASTTRPRRFDREAQSLPPFVQGIKAGCRRDSSHTSLAANSQIAFAHNYNSFLESRLLNRAAINFRRPSRSIHRQPKSSPTGQSGGVRGCRRSSCRRRVAPSDYFSKSWDKHRRSENKAHGRH